MRGTCLRPAFGDSLPRAVAPSPRTESAVVDKFFNRQANVASDLSHQRWGNVASFVYRDGSAATVGMALFDMRTALAPRVESEPLKHSADLRSLRTGTEPILKPLRCFECPRIRLRVAVRRLRATWKLLRVDCHEVHPAITLANERPENRVRTPRAILCLGKLNDSGEILHGCIYPASQRMRKGPKSCARQRDAPVSARV